MLSTSCALINYMDDDKVYLQLLLFCQHIELKICILSKSLTVHTISSYFCTVLEKLEGVKITDDKLGILIFFSLWHCSISKGEILMVTSEIAGKARKLPYLPTYFHQRSFCPVHI